MNIKLNDCQKELKNALETTNAKTFICDWDRGSGKSYMLAYIILEEKPKNVLYLGERGIAPWLIRERIEEIRHIYKEEFDKSVTSIKEILDGVLTITFNDNSISKVYIYDLKEDKYKDVHFDYIMFDNLLPIPLDYKYNKIISMVTIDGDQKLKKFYKNVFILTNKKEKHLKFDIMDNLKEELICLTKKIKEEREKENFGTYKNLIVAYKEILTIYKDLHRFIYQ